MLLLGVELSVMWLFIVLIICLVMIKLSLVLLNLWVIFEFVWLNGVNNVFCLFIGIFILVLVIEIKIEVCFLLSKW